MKSIQKTIDKLEQQLEAARKLQKQQQEEEERKKASLESKKQEELEALKAQRTMCLNQLAEEKISLENEQQKHKQLFDEKIAIENKQKELNDFLESVLTAIEKAEEEKRLQIEQKGSINANIVKTDQNIIQLSLAINNKTSIISELDEKINRLSVTLATTVSSPAVDEMNKSLATVGEKSTSSKKRSLSSSQNKPADKKNKVASNSSVVANNNTLFNTTKRKVKLTPKGKLPRELGYVIGSNNSHEYSSLIQDAIDTWNSSSNMPSKR